jgi:hypothetical protein
MRTCWALALIGRLAGGSLQYVSQPNWLTRICGRNCHSSGGNTASRAQSQPASLEPGAEGATLTVVHGRYGRRQARLSHHAQHDARLCRPRRTRCVHRCARERAAGTPMFSASHLEGRQMASTSGLIRANDLTFNYVVSGWLMGQVPRPSTSWTGTPTAPGCQLPCTPSTCAALHRERAGPWRDGAIHWRSVVLPDRLVQLALSRCGRARPLAALRAQGPSSPPAGQSVRCPRPLWHARRLPGVLYVWRGGGALFC